MKPSSLRALLAVATATLLTAPLAHAQQQGPFATPIKVPAPRTVAPASTATGGQRTAAAPVRILRTVPVLSTPSGLASSSSSALAGFSSTDPNELDAVMKSVSAISVAADFKADQSMPAQTMGPVQISSGADVSLNAHFDKVAGGTTPVLDSLDLTASGVALKGPLGMSLPVEHVSVDSKGQISAKLNSWLPQITISRVEHKTNGDVILHGGSWFVPDITIHKDGSVTGPLGVNLGKADAKIFATWPPTLASLGALGAGGGGAPLPQINQLAGNLKWDVSTKLSNSTLAFGGKVIQGQADAELKGNGRLAGGQISTIGTQNTAKVTLRVGPQTIQDGKGNSATIKASDVLLTGNYRLTAPLKDTAKNLVVDFNGKASYNLDPTNINLSLPNGAKVSVGEVDLQGTETFSVKDNKGAVSMTDDGTYAAQVKGPIHVQNLGPVPSLDLAGTITATGHDKLVNGRVVIQGSATGEETIVKAIGVAQRLSGQTGEEIKTTIKAGSKVSVNLTDLETSLGLGFVKTGNLKNLQAEVGNVSAKGTLAGHVALGDTSVTTPNLKLDESAAEGDVTVGIDTSKGTTVKGNVKLDAPATVAVATPSGLRGTASIDAGSNLGLDATISSVSSNGKTLSKIDGKILGALGASNVAAQGPGMAAKVNGDARAQISAPFSATVGQDGKVNLDPTKTTAQVPVSMALNKGTRVIYTKDGVSTNVTMDKDGSYVKVTGDFALDAQGKPIMKDLNNADVFLTLGPASATVAGVKLDMNAEKTLHYTGRVVFRAGGMDVYGSAQVGINGDNVTPILSVNF